MTYHFDWGDRSPVDTSDAEALGDGRHIYAKSGAYLVRVTAYIARDGRVLTISCKPLPLTVTAPPRRLGAALTLAGLAILSGLVYFALRPKVSCVYGSTRWDLPRFSGVETTHVAVSFRPGTRRAQHSIRILR